jgi:small subunit ribosomal protein S15
MKKHLKAHKGDVHNKTKLIHVESKIKRLVKYYREVGMLPKKWKYEPEQAALLVR